jgi:hypothetical protein
VIPQLIELAAWVSGDHAEFFTHLIDIDPAALLRSGVAFADPVQKARLVERILDLAGKNQFFDESGYWRFWRDLDHPALPFQLKEALADLQQHLMVRRVAIDIAKECRRPELVPTLFEILRSQDGDSHFRSSVADALCASMPDDRLSELDPLVRGEVGPDPDQSILGEALQRLVPQQWSVADALPFIGRTMDPSFLGSYWRALEHHLAEHLTDADILPGLQAIQTWDGSFSSSSFRRKLSMNLLLRGLDHIDDLAICSELVKLWKSKARNFHEFFRSGDRKDSDFAMMTDDPRRNWIAAIINSTDEIADDHIDLITWDTYRLTKPEDFGWLLEGLLKATDEAVSAWAKAVLRMIWNEEIRVAWWDEFIDAYRRSPALRAQMPWFEETFLDSPSRRSAKAQWLWRERRFERLTERCRKRENTLDPDTEFVRAFTQISAGESWAFKDLCWALSLDGNGHDSGHLGHDITGYPGWATITEQQKEFVREAARQFLLDRSDGWDEVGARTNYFDPGVAAIWLLRDEIESNDALRAAVGLKWMEAILAISDSSSGPIKELFALAYRINPLKAITGWTREIRRDCERHGHPFAIRMAELCFDGVLAEELIEFIKVLNEGGFRLLANKS